MLIISFQHISQHHIYQVTSNKYTITRKTNRYNTFQFQSPNKFKQMFLLCFYNSILLRCINTTKALLNWVLTKAKNMFNDHNNIRLKTQQINPSYTTEVINNCKKILFIIISGLYIRAPDIHMQKFKRNNKHITINMKWKDMLFF